jgi:hypothetical protein
LTTINPDSPLGQALAELLLHERATGTGGAANLMELGAEADWQTLARRNAAETLAHSQQEPQRQLEAAFLRGAALAAQAAEVSHRRSAVFHPPHE